MEINSINDLGPEYTCPITLEAPEDPVKTRCGHVFERVALLHSLSRNPTCPLCRSDVNENELEDLVPRVNEVAQEVMQPQSPPAQRNEAPRIHPRLHELVQASHERQAVEQQLAGHEQEAADRLAAHQVEVDQKILEILLRLTS